ncbi:DUF6203 family protein [Planomonospora venezuelensis]|uniref:Cytochrome c-type biogenesis protein CcmH/NrfF n=1 Tax=Planomonospora venezuelensis TaxID=1999 RepID=A0A841DGC6_PLAVE|nr:DUF6203 family protein [Planomonospora venezuelensis]MBB5967145.1 cytochrome c-type biogenesis protein CcmH/NrfF [Planomonospora venezuelensis]
MKRFFKVVVVRWLSRTPLGLVLLGAGWWFGRRRRRRAQLTASGGPDSGGRRRGGSRAGRGSAVHRSPASR